ncbi:hypothetical protein AJ85_16010 [Alkalihalobacillus alcalophilus ATCC 27647 = CGMCC 1.3604]|uniref:Uncharacterized protein n=1 Tax=Alkalihalobacillus alcalophilus ATCC 27647 = CGMCC 1.3604 TaxID=1218173 RepID=A0A094XF81_ALKAL|nr:hypothetical protein BALCAV_0210130 [Alkalihalobacillus alcalophilus ATCC 27647 = CGMCC 1.3604]THG89638.1 hypothetical protein AJ85_16010 [Alkalihalobacillus alcalophilus ATCC 27647 = CGMCC 1.3604]
MFNQNGASGISEERETPQRIAEEAPDSSAERVGYAAGGVIQLLSLLTKQATLYIKGGNCYDGG